MRTMIAFMKKEWLWQIRSGRLIFTAALFVLFGIMNPAVAKMTPWLLEMFSESLAESGMTITQVTVSAMDSWLQFFKNIPMGLIAFVLIQSSIFTKEYSSGSLVLSLTKGLGRPLVVMSKTSVLFALWSVGFWLCFGITYGYNAYFWDNSIANSLFAACVLWWLFGVWVISLVSLFSVVSSSSTGVLLGCGGVVLACYIVSIIPKISKYLPTFLTDGNSLIYGTLEVKDYCEAIIITLVTSIICFALSVPVFNKKQL